MNKQNSYDDFGGLIIGIVIIVVIALLVFKNNNRNRESGEWHCVDATSYNKNPYDDNKCVKGSEVKYVSDSEARKLDPKYSPGQSGHSYYNSK